MNRSPSAAFRRGRSIRTSGRRQAYTLTEMALVIAIVGVLATMTLPAVIPLMRGNRLRNGTNLLNTALQAARLKALSMRGRYALVVTQYVTQAEVAASGGETTLPVAYLEIRGVNDADEILVAEGTEKPYELPPGIFIDTDPDRDVDSASSRNTLVAATEDGAATALPNTHMLAIFKPDGGLDTPSGATELRYRSLWLVDYPTIPGKDNGWRDATTSDRTEGTSYDPPQPWSRYAVRITRLFGKVSVVDPDDDFESEDALLAP